MKRFLDWLKPYIADLPTTPVTIVVGLLLAILYVLWALIAATLKHPIDMNTLDTVGLFIASLVTAGVTQFGVKRVTDHGYVAAKNGTPPTDPSTPRPSTAVATVIQP